MKKRKPMFMTLFQEMWDVWFPDNEKVEKEKGEKEKNAKEISNNVPSYLDYNGYKEDELKYKKDDDEY